MVPTGYHAIFVFDMCLIWRYNELKINRKTWWPRRLTCKRWCMLRNRIPNRKLLREFPQMPLQVELSLQMQHQQDLFLQIPHVCSFRFAYHHHHHDSPGFMISVLFRIAMPLLQWICLFGNWRFAGWGKHQKNQGKESCFKEKTCAVNDKRSWDAAPQRWQRWHWWFWQWQRW